MQRLSGGSVGVIVGWGLINHGVAAASHLQVILFVTRGAPASET